MTSYLQIATITRWFYLERLKPALAALDYESASFRFPRSIPIKTCVWDFGDGSLHGRCSECGLADLH